MPALFPELFDFSMIAAVILRDAVGFYLVLLGERLLRKLRTSTEGVSSRQRIAGYVYGVSEMIVGALLVIGLFTQGAALGGMALAGVSLLFGTGRGGHPSERHVQVLLVVMCSAILFLGAGPFAYDLPL